MKKSIYEKLQEVERLLFAAADEDADLLFVLAVGDGSVQETACSGNMGAHVAIEALRRYVRHRITEETLS